MKTGEGGKKNIRDRGKKEEYVGRRERSLGKMSSSDPDLQRREIGAVKFVSVAETRKFLLVRIGTFIDVPAESSSGKKKSGRT